MGAETAVLSTDTLNNVVLGVFVVFAIVGAWAGFAKGFVRSAVKVASIVLAIVVAFFAMPLVVPKVYQLALPYLDDALSSFAELFVASPTLKEYFPTLVMGLTSPLLFVVVFALCLLVVAIVRAITNGLLKSALAQKSSSLGRIGGLVCGAVAGVLVALCFVFPVTGYLTAVPTIYTNVREFVYTDDNPIHPQVEEVIINLPNISAVKTVNQLTAKQFDKFVAYQDGEKKFSTLDDLTTLTSLISPAMRFKNSVGSISTLDDQSLRDISAILQTNDKLRVLATEIANYASKKWLNNEPFVGYNLKEKFDPEYKLVLDLMLTDLANCTPDTIVEVLNKIADTLQVVREVFG